MNSMPNRATPEAPLALDVFSYFTCSPITNVPCRDPSCILPKCLDTLHAACISNCNHLAAGTPPGPLLSTPNPVMVSEYAIALPLLPLLWLCGAVPRVLGVQPPLREGARAGSSCPARWAAVSDTCPARQP